MISDLSRGDADHVTQWRSSPDHVIGERQRSIADSFRRLIRQRKLSQDPVQRDHLSPDDMTFQQYFEKSPLLRRTVDKLVKDYERDLEWYTHSKVLKRETLEHSPLKDGVLHSSSSSSTSSLVSSSSSLSSSSPRPHSSRRRSESLSRSWARLTAGGRRHVRHSRKKFKQFKEKPERSGWGGGYG